MLYADAAENCKVVEAWSDSCAIIGVKGEGEVDVGRGGGLAHAILGRGDDCDARGWGSGRGKGLGLGFGGKGFGRGKRGRWWQCAALGFWKKSVCNLVRLPKPKGSEPERPIAGRHNMVTLSLVQTTSVHKQGLVWVAFHDNVRPPTSLRSNNSLALSKVRSELAMANTHVALPYVMAVYDLDWVLMSGRFNVPD
ncbi:hypothetical protein E2542_SST28870 [Spatholobus suberectus]|nr:hypothetical protein E2542_SST28870 [Spatholobus suberectus]